MLFQRPPQKTNTDSESRQQRQRARCVDLVFMMPSGSATANGPSEGTQGTQSLNCPHKSRTLGWECSSLVEHSLRMYEAMGLILRQRRKLNRGIAESVKCLPYKHEKKMEETWGWPLAYKCICIHTTLHIGTHIYTHIQMHTYIRHDTATMELKRCLSR